MFPGAGANIYRNEAGEPTGWDSGDDDGPYEPDDYLNYDEPDDDEGDEGDEGDDQAGSHLPVDPATGCESTGADEIETDHEAPEPLEPDDAEVSWQEYGRAETYSESACNCSDPNCQA